MSLLMGLLIYLCLSHGQSAGPEVVFDIGIKLCNIRCIQTGSCRNIAYDPDKLACHLSGKGALNCTMGRLATYPKTRGQNLGGACSTMDCELNTRCVERRGGGAVCVEGGTVSSSLESSCLTDSDCSSVRRFVCFTKTCKCTPGYSFNPANNSCVGRCNTYGDRFTTYQSLYIQGNNDGIKIVSSTEECSYKCITEKTFTCLTYEFSSFVCQLSKSGYLDVNTSQRGKNDHQGSLAVRNCE